MRLLATLSILFAPLVAAGDSIDRQRLDRIDEAVAAAIRRGDCPGAVVLIVHRDEVVFRKAYGNRALQPEKVPMTPDTVFDMASITKPVATATSVFTLVEQGKLRLSEKVATYWPEFAANKKDEVTVEHLLLHTSGLIADNPLADYKDGKAEAMKRVAALSLEAEPGTRFRYSDVGFIVLGELVERVSGQPVSEFARKHVLEPLKMADTGYVPGDKVKERCAPTAQRDGRWLIGEVHDPRAAAMGGIAGHAGLFGTADDLARYARMLLHEGELDGARVLSPLTVRLLTTPVPVPGGQRSRGWDVDTSYSVPRGELFPRGEGFGHTGFTGTSIWIDPPSQTAVIVLTNRVHISERVQVIGLRRDVANIVAGALFGTRTGVRPIPTSDVRCGIDVLEAEKFERLKGRNIGLVTNHTGRDRRGRATADVLHAAEGVKLVALFSPEHGIRGELDQSNITDATDAKTGLPVYSLYGKRRKPDAETLKGIDTLVYDIQDIGCRFYTYISTLGLVLESAAENKVKLVVLDRPNPIGGLAIDGPLTDAGRESFIAYHSLPIRHGMTVGELAKLFVAERKLNVELEVVKCEGWKRGDFFDRTGLTWVNPSPNMRNLTAALLYPGIGPLETTNLSVGRGTKRPFEWIGAPWLDGPKLAGALNAAGLSGVRFVSVNLTPASSVHAKKPCGGVQIIVDDWNRFNPLRTGLTVAATLRDLFPDHWEMKNYDRLLVHKASYDAFKAGKPVAEIEKAWAGDLKAFRARRSPHLLYPE
ncbi:MAG TPA: exo-beta-N-acetylmuramidase NamZ domain-containing protein [Gemmataceae bacterium]|nr:exo-beta-N-acetylmuramidase NamZ domain-containing protein [Gemmataceae bacterium]